jgi:hypothetical protein
VIALLLIAQIYGQLGVYPLPPIVGMSGESRTYHRVDLAEVGTSKWTHLETCGRVTLVKREADGDSHIRLDAAGAFIVLEIVPYHVMDKPKVGQTIVAQGISRIDKTHRWPELNPLEAWHAVGSCKT